MQLFRAYKNSILFRLAMVLSMVCYPSIFGCSEPEIEGVKNQAAGLIWQKCPVGLKGENCRVGSPVRKTWAEAGKVCETLNWSGFSWRLPTISELLNLRRCRDGWKKSRLIGVDSCKSDIPKKEADACRHIRFRCDGMNTKPSIDDNVFPATPMDGFWSASEHNRNSRRAWGITFDQGYVQTATKGNKLYVRCVADITPQPAPQ